MKVKSEFLRLVTTIVISQLIVFCTVGIPATAQLLQPTRFEKEQKNSEDYYNVISLKEKGLVLFRERDKYKNSNRLWELVKLDTALQEQKKLELEIKDRYKMVGYEALPDGIYLLFRTGETTKNDFELIEITPGSEEPKRYSIKPELDFKLTHFIKVNNSFAFGGYVNNEPGIFLYDLTTSNIKIVPGFFQKDTELVELRANINQTFNVIMVDRSSRSDRKLIFRAFDSQGEMLLDDIVPVEDNRNLQTAITSTLEREDLIVLGTWGDRNSKQSIGFYSMRVDPYSDQKIKYTDFGQLNHALDYLNPKRAARIKADSKEYAKNGRTPGFGNYTMPYRILEHKSGYLLLAEVYTPTSSSSTYAPNSPYGYSPFYTPYGLSPYGSYYYPGYRMYRPMYGNNVKNADEIKTDEAMLVSFDANGKVLWDHSIKLDELKMASLEQAADFSLIDSKIHFLYKKESELRAKWIDIDDDSEGELTEKIISMKPGDLIRSDHENEGGVRHWYNNVFYVWGYQTIKNNSEEDRTRDVFYINKVVVH